jgi:hypothetical protein
MEAGAGLETVALPLPFALWAYDTGADHPSSGKSGRDRAGERRGTGGREGLGDGDGTGSVVMGGADSNLTCRLGGGEV